MARSNPQAVLSPERAVIEIFMFRGLLDKLQLGKLGQRSDFRRR